MTMNNEQESNLKMHTESAKQEIMNHYNEQFKTSRASATENTLKTYADKKLTKATLVKWIQEQNMPQQKQQNTKIQKCKSEGKETHTDSDQFRLMNQQIYTSDTSASFKKFSSKPELFVQYHQEYAQKIQNWKKKPFDVVCDLIAKHPSLQRLADVGCGDAQIARKFGNQFEVVSFDMGSNENNKDFVTICNMTSLPVMYVEYFDVALYCLSIMGTNQRDILNQAKKVIRKGGQLWILEVSSRLKNKKVYIRGVESFGFKLLEFKEIGGYFFASIFEKEKFGKFDGVDKILEPSICK
ncbi:Ribosomal_RNA-processing protein [Hexamita inflata]|uniref:Ribosomal RNA-processing protein 8 n=1 Tax=Hexamita inflata TaxID=28002 RepID=A0AA86NAI9_9EUKA|nr:Ribosomal RNA-processing protein [Hexamita inflata]